MSKKIQDYLHLYLMADVLIQAKRKNDSEYVIGRMCEITRNSNHGDWVEVWFNDVITVTSNIWETSSSNCHWFFFSEDHIKPILRSLSDMTPEEARQMAALSEWHEHFREVSVDRSKFGDLIVTWQGANESREMFNATGEMFYCSEQFLWLLRKGFDLFNLIPDGLAIDKTSLKKQAA